MTDEDDDSGKDQLPERKVGKRVAPADLLNAPMENLSDQQIRQLSEVAAKEAIELRKRELERDSLEIRSRKEAEDHVQTFNDLDRESRNAHEVITKSKTATGDRTITSRSGAARIKSPCFVATAAFGGDRHSTVANLRKWRDEELIRHTCGRRFVNWYEINGPRAADWLNANASLKPIVRVLLNAISVVLTLKRLTQYRGGHRSEN
jgi:hypothetical protein